jgi:hypothetical protein
LFRVFRLPRNNFFVENSDEDFFYWVQKARLVDTAAEGDRTGEANSLDTPNLTNHNVSRPIKGWFG